MPSPFDGSFPERWTLRCSEGNAIACVFWHCNGLLKCQDETTLVCIECVTTSISTCAQLNTSPRLWSLKHGPIVIRSATDQGCLCHSFDKKNNVLDSQHQILTQKNRNHISVGDHNNKIVLANNRAQVRSNTCVATTRTTFPFLTGHSASVPVCNSSAACCENTALKYFGLGVISVWSLCNTRSRLRCSKFMPTSFTVQILSRFFCEKLVWTRSSAGLGPVPWRFPQSTCFTQ